MSNKTRLNFIDAMKGIAILMVAFFHILLPSEFKNVINHLMGPCLIMFFCLSGYFFTPGKKSYMENLKNKAKGLMIPFLKYSVAFWGIGTAYHMVADKMSFMEALCCLRNFFGGCIWNRVIQDHFNWDYHHLGKLYMFLADFWFLLALMVAFVVFLAIADWALKTKARSIGTMAGLIAVEATLLHFAVNLPYNLQNTPFYVMLLLLGSFLRKVQAFGYIEKKFNAAADWAFGILMLAIGTVWTMFLEPLENLFRGSFGEHQVANMLLSTGCAIVFILGIGTLMRRIELSGLNIKALSYIGEHSLHIYIYHMFFAFFVSKLTNIALASSFGEDNLPTTKDHLLALVLALICIGLSLGIEWISRKIKTEFIGKK